MNKAEFYKALRKRESGLFGTSLSQPQVEGLEAILGECMIQGCDLGQAAYILATAYGETGGKMQPRRENMNYSASRLLQVWPSRFPNAAATRGYARNPRALANKVYGSRMGNRPGTDDGWNFRGNGIGQITGRNNHGKWGDRLGIPLLSHPELMEKLDVSVRSLVQPMMEGWATGRKLSQYVNGASRDYHGARKVWGGVDPAKYVGYAKSFEAALLAADYTGTPAEPAKEPETSPEPSGGLLAAIIAAILSMVKK